MTLRYRRLLYHLMGSGFGGRAARRWLIDKVLCTEGPPCPKENIRSTENIRTKSRRRFDACGLDFLYNPQVWPVSLIATGRQLSGCDSPSIRDLEWVGVRKRCARKRDVILECHRRFWYPVSPWQILGPALETSDL